MESYMPQVEDSEIQKILEKNVAVTRRKVLAILKPLIKFSSRDEIAPKKEHFEKSLDSALHPDADQSKRVLYGKNIPII